MSLRFSPPLSVASVCLLTLAGCSGTSALAVDAGSVTDAALVDAFADPRDDASTPDDASAPDASGPDDASAPDASVPDASAPVITSCVDGVRAIANDEEGVRGIGLAPLGEGWAALFRVRADAFFLARLDANGTAIGEPIPVERSVKWIGRGAINLRALGDGVLVHSGSGVRFVRADGTQPFAELALETLVLGPSTGAAVMGISGDDVVRITVGDAGLAVERFPSGLVLDGYEEPIGGYITSRSMGVSADGCLAVANLTFSYEDPTAVRTLPVVPGAACADETYAWERFGSFGVFDSLVDGRFVTVAGLYPDPEVSRGHIAQLATLGGEALVAVGEPFGMRLSYGVRAAIASTPDRTIIATMHASNHGDSAVSLWRSTGGTPEAITVDGRSENTGVYLAWHPTLDRVAALYGTDSAGDGSSEHTLGLRCDL